MKRFLAAIAVLAVAGLLAWMNWDKIGPTVNPVLGIQATTAATPETGSTSLGAAPNQRYRFVLIDPTTSTDTSFRESMKGDIIAAVKDYVPPKPTESKVGVAAITGLQLTVRLVGTNSLAYGQPNVAISIPSVPELPARPDMTASGALDPGGPYDAWKKSEAVWSTSYDAAVTAVDASVKSLQGLNVATDENSGILAGTAALALLAPADGDIAFAVLSDLDDNRGTQPANFNGHPFLAVQPDPAGDINRWDGLFNTFSSWATSSGAGPITRVRPEDASTAITTFITGS